MEQRNVECLKNLNEVTKEKRHEIINNSYFFNLKIRLFHPFLSVKNIIL